MKIDRWKELVRKMRTAGYTIPAIKDTLVNLDMDIPERTLYHITRKCEATDTKISQSLSFLDALLFLNDDLPASTFCNILLDFSYTNEEAFSKSSPCVFDCSDAEYADDIMDELHGYGVHVWYPTKNTKDGLKSYLDDERRQNRQEEKLPYYGQR